MFRYRLLVLDRWSLPTLMIFLTLVTAPASLPAFAENVYQIGFVEIKKDSRYKKKVLYARFLGKALGRPYAGAEIAVKELRFHGKELGVSFAIDRKQLRNIDSLAQAMHEFRQQNIDFVIADLAADALQQAGTIALANGITLLNISANDNLLRQQACMVNIYHVAPSESMLSDALNQYLAAMKWREVLVLAGPTEADQQSVKVFQQSAKRYGVKIIDVREFVLGNDPRVREKNNPKLLTKGSYDVIYVADSHGEFARQLPFKTLKPIPVVGAEGLAPQAWHWSWDRFGAPQLEKRFEKLHSRHMGNADWAAWMAVKIIAKAIQSTTSLDNKKLLEFFSAPEAIFDGFKGNRLNFRSWNNQLRQPLLLTTHNWVIDSAPITGFLHKTENLDTLGIDAQENTCSF